MTADDAQAAGARDATALAIEILAAAAEGVDSAQVGARASAQVQTVLAGVPEDRRQATMGLVFSGLVIISLTLLGEVAAHNGQTPSQVLAELGVGNAQD